jgi:hypothetical protein
MVWAIHNPDMHKAVIELTKSRSDRIAAVVGAAIVDEALLGVLYSRMKKSGVFNLLFDPNRPLGNYAARYNLAYLLGACTDDIRKALEGIGEIRNAFAHNLAVSNFTDPSSKLTQGYAKLDLHTKYKFFLAPFLDGLSNNRIPKVKTRRTIFIVNMQIVLLLLMRDQRTHLLHSNQYTKLPSAPVNYPPASTKKKAASKKKQ